MAVKKKVTKKIETKDLVISLFTGEKAYKWRCIVGQVELECIGKTYTTAAAAKKAGTAWLKDNLK